MALEEDLVAAVAPVLAAEEVVEADVVQGAEEAKVAMCPPTPIPGRCARETIAAAFQRVALRIFRSTSSLPGKNGSSLVAIVLT